MKKIKQETPSHKASVIGDKLVVNGKVYFHYDVPKKWLPVNSSVNTHEDYGNGTAEQQEPLQSQEESSNVMVQSQELQTLFLSLQIRGLSPLKWNSLFSCFPHG